MRTRSGRIAVTAGIAVVVIALAGVALTLWFGRGDAICKGVSISGVDVGSTPRTAASRVVRQWASTTVNRQVTLTALDRRWQGTFAGLGLRLDWQEAVDRAYRVGREGSIVKRAICVWTRGGSGKRIIAKSLVDPSVLDNTLEKVAQAVNRPHQDARIAVVDSRLQINQEAFGIKLDEKAAAAILSAAAGRGQNIIPLPIVTDPPRVTARDCAGINTLLAGFTTTFNPGLRGRTRNLTLAAKSFDGRVMKPSEVFSINEAVGPRLVGRGFRMAQIFVKGELVDGIGGGVCQVSSTLFNAVLLAGLKVVERSPHSERVPYIAAGRDATVAWGQKDFRFQNSARNPIGIVCVVGSSRLTVQIYGSAIDKKQVRVYTSGVRYFGGGSKTFTDASMPAGARKVISKGGSGAEVVLYRKMPGENGSDIVDAFRSRYPARRSVIAVGTGAPSPSQQSSY